MKKVVFLTGGTGGMGMETIKKMVENPDEIELKVLARDSEKNHQKLAPFEGKLEVIWGDLLDFDLLSSSMEGGRLCVPCWSAAQSVLYGLSG